VSVTVSPILKFMSSAEMSTRENEVLQTALAILKEALDPPRIILFGSRAEGRHGRTSDFDLAVDVAKPSGGKFSEIRDAVNDAIGLYKADILFLPSVDPEFRDLVLSTGKVVYERKG
jgi:predicted nucleotidyltransferase